MSDVPETRGFAEVFASVPMRHWFISGAALIWNVFGFMVFLMTVRATPEQLAVQYSPAQVAFMEDMPIWATSANAIAVTAGVLACIMLLLRKALALPFFVVSLIALLVWDLHSFVLEDVTAIFGMVPAYIQGTVLVIAISLIFYARGAKNRGLLT